MRILTRIFAGIGVMFVISTILGITSLIALARHQEPPPPKFTLAFDFAGGVTENADANPFASAMGDTSINLRDLIRAIDRAGKDSRVQALLISTSRVDLDSAQIEEVRSALKRFNESGKKSYAYADSFGEFGPGNRPYWLASAASEIWMQPLGSVALTGAAVSMPFARNLLDKIGIVPDIHQRHEFKGAAANLSESAMPAPLRQNYTKLVDDLESAMMRDIAASRNIKPEELKKIVDRAPLLDQESLTAKLIDHLDYADKLEAALSVPTVPLYSLQDYLGDNGSSNSKGKPVADVALVYIDGAIVPSEQDSGPMGEKKTASAESLTQSLKEIAENKDIKAVVLRINSPGGSVTASESILRMVKVVRESGKYVVVSMGGAAASGGYWIASGADYILASPSTLTGSIGVVGGKFVIGPLLEKLGVNWANIGTGANSTMWSADKPFSGTGLARVDAGLDHIYNSFVQRVSEGRKLSPQQVDAVARGRVWSGASAKEVGLVDELGGLRESFAVVRRQLKLDENALLSVTLYPAPEPPGRRLLALIRQFVSSPALSPLSVEKLGQALLAPPVTGALYYLGPNVE